MCEQQLEPSRQSNGPFEWQLRIGSGGTSICHRANYEQTAAIELCMQFVFVASQHRRGGLCAIVIEQLKYR